MNYFDTVKLENIQIKAGEDVPPFVAGASINAEGENYYEFQKTITTPYTCVIRGDSGRVRYVCEDASSIAPGIGERVLGIDTLPEDFFDFPFSYWMFDGEAMTPYPLTPEEMVVAAELKKQQLMQKATAVIAPLQDAVDLGKATPEETERLTAWKEYRLALSRIDTSLAPNVNWPAPPQI